MSTRIRQVLALLIAAAFIIYAGLRFALTNFTLGASGNPVVVELFFGGVFAYGIYRWDETMLKELGGGKYVRLLGSAFEWLGVLLGVGCLAIGATALFLFRTPPN